MDLGDICHECDPRARRQDNIAPSRTKALQASLTLRKFVGDLGEAFARTQFWPPNPLDQVPEVAADSYELV